MDYQLNWQWNPVQIKVLYDVLITNVSDGGELAFEGTLSEFAQLTKSEIASWFQFDREYLVSARPFQIHNSVKIPGRWSSRRHNTSPVAKLPVHDAASLGQVGWTSGSTGTRASNNG
ncbi:MAG: hypothetical protein U0996_05210 [Planctomycetaceae bacterium]